MPVLVISSPKGGVGRTTLAANLGPVMTRLGWRVTLVDLHSQNGLRHLVAPDSGVADGLGPAAHEGRKWTQPSVKTRTGMVLVPFGPAGDLEPPISAGLLREQIAELCPTRRDLAILDTPAGEGQIARAADQVADVGLAVFHADAGSASLLPDYAKGRFLTPLRPADPVRYLVLNQVDRRRRLSLDIEQFIDRRLESRFLGAVRYDEAMAEAAAQNLTLTEDAEAAGAAADVAELARKLQAVLA